MKVGDPRTGIRRVEVSNSACVPPNTRWVTVNTDNLSGRGDIALYNVEIVDPDAPVIILLHGAHASHWSWMYSGGLHQAYAALKSSHGIANDFVLVMPSDGLRGDATGYLPLASGNYERWIVCDVPAAVDRVVACVSANSRIYLAGISMGGYGALRLAAKYPRMFAGISCHSPVVSLSALGVLRDVDGPESPIGQVDGEDADILNWMARSSGGPLPSIRIDCGTSDRLIESIRGFHRTLAELGVPHEYSEFAGGHDWDYWARRIGDSLRFFDRIEKNLGAAATSAAIG